MPKASVTEGPSLYPLEEGVIYDATLVGCVEDPVEFTYKRGEKAGQKGRFLKWKWTFVVEPDGIEVQGSTEPRITAATDAEFLPLARPYVESLLGRQIELGEEIDTDDLIGLPCKITIKHQEPRPRRNGDGFWYNVEVADVFPAFGAPGTSVEEMAQAPQTYIAEPPY